MRCGECRYWHPLFMGGECRIRAPWVTQASYYPKSSWPQTAAKDWCGEFERDTLSSIASVDTHPKGGDVQQAPLVSGAVPEGETPPCR